MKIYYAAYAGICLGLFANNAVAQQAKDSSSSDLDALLSGDPAPSKSAAADTATAPPEPTPEPAAQPAATNAGTPQAAPETTQTIPVAELPAAAATPARRKSQPLAAIEEIVVTAQKKSESINDVPIAINAYSGDTLKALGVTDTRDLGNLVPGFTAKDSGYNTPVYTLRGVGFNDTTYTATSTVGVYVDEVNQPYSIMTKGLALDLERVEVLKGPQGILYGRNTTGGAINYVANKPSEEFAAGVTGIYSRFQTTDVEAFVNGNISGALNGRLAVRAQHADQGSQYSRTRPNDHLDQPEKQSLRGSLGWHASDKVNVSLVVNAWNDESKPRAPQVIFVSEQNPSDPAGVFLPPQVRNYPTIPQDGADPQVADWSPTEKWRLHDRFLQAALHTDWQITDDLKSTTIASAERVESNNSLFPQSGYNFNNAEQVIKAHINTGALESRLSGSLFDSTLDWMVGGNLSHDSASEYHNEFVDFQSLLFPDPVTGRSTLGSRAFVTGSPTIDQFAGFLNTVWHFRDTFTLSAGARLTQTNENYTGCTGEGADSVSTAPGGSISSLFTALSAQQAALYTATTGKPGSPSVINKGDCFTLADNGSNAPYSAKLNQGNLSYRVALDWKPIEDYLFYASVGRGYKAGGFPVLTASAQSQLTPVTQEKLQAYEIGSKTSFFDKQLHIDAAIYDYDYKNKQLLTKILDPVFGPLPVLRNAPSSEVIGAELALQYVPSFAPGLFLGANGAYTYTKILEFQSINSRSQPQNFAGSRFNFAPLVQYSLIANYSLPISEFLNATVGADYNHTSITNSTIENDPRFKIGAYGLVGVRLGLNAADGRWSATLFGRNVLNEFSTLATYQNGDAIARVPGAPRTFGITLSYNFNPAGH